MGIFSTINSFIQSSKQKKQAAAIKPVNTTYAQSAADTNSFSPFAKSLYSEGKNIYQGRMAGANAVEQNLLTQSANFGAGVDANATSGAQAIAAKVGALGQANQSITDLGTMEAQDKQRRFGIYSNVSQQMQEEGDRVYQDKLRNYYDDLNYKRGLEGASMQNKAGAWAGVDDTVMGAVRLFTPGGLLAGKGGGNVKTAGLGSMDRMYNPNLNLQQGASPASQFGRIPYRPMINR